MKRIGWATDTHLNFIKKNDKAFTRLVSDITDAQVEALLLCGDTAEAESLEDNLCQLQASIGIPIYFVLGNHDYYGSSITATRALALRIDINHSDLYWLPAAGNGFIELSPEVAMLGVGGWGDARLGTPESSSVMLSDFWYISELHQSMLTKTLHNTLRREGDREADLLTRFIKQSGSSYKVRLIVTHVPPFREACWHERKISNDNWLPYFSCDAAGRVLRAEAGETPNIKTIVFCGHTHGWGYASILPNLTVVTGGSTYGRPRLQGVIELENKELTYQFRGHYGERVCKTLSWE